MRSHVIVDLSVSSAQSRQQVIGKPSQIQDKVGRTSEPHCAGICMQHCADMYMQHGASLCWPIGRAPFHRISMLETRRHVIERNPLNRNITHHCLVHSLAARAINPRSEIDFDVFVLQRDSPALGPLHYLYTSLQQQSSLCYVLSVTIHL